MNIRAEAATDANAISAMLKRAFSGHPCSSGSESAIVRALRAQSALAVSLVAEVQGKVIGHVAFSPVTVGDGAPLWYGLGPLAVEPKYQGLGIGASLVQAGLARLRQNGAAGCVVLGDPAYYGRFGFRSDSGITYAGPPPENFMALALSGPVARGEVGYHEAFGAKV